MLIRTYRSADDFLKAVQPVLGQHEVLNNLPLGLGLAIKKSPERFTTTPTWLRLRMRQVCWWLLCAVITYRLRHPR